MRWTDMGTGGLIGEHMPLADVLAWLDTHEDANFEIVDEADGLPACGLDTGMAGGAVGCDCHRCSPSLYPWLRAVLDLLAERFICFRPEEEHALRAALPSIVDETTFRAAMPPGALDGALLDEIVARIRAS